MPILIALLLLMQLGASCSKPAAPKPPAPPANPCLVAGVDTCLANAYQNATVSLDQEKQVMHSFGASDCWGIKFIGKNWPESKRNEIADLLFSKEFDANGNPKGIGLSMWRVNIGAGSLEQGAASKISSEWRREESFQDASGNYDWTKQAGNRWFAKAAKARGVEHLLAFSISAPVHMTKNGYAFGPSGNDKGKLNLKSDKYAAYANFMVDVLERFKTEGMEMNYISPINEPQWDWEANASGVASQEGTAATNQESLALIRELDKSLVSKGVTTKIAYGEAAQLSFLAGSVSWLSDRTDVFNYFWNKSSSGYIGNLNRVEKVVSGHSYFSQPDVPTLVNNRKNLLSRMTAVNNEVSFWQSEYCILSGEDGIQGGGRDLGIQTALYIARIMHHDLAMANASSWQWWLGVSPGDYKDGLVYVADQSGNMGELQTTKSDGIILKSKMLWAMGNYSRFIRPGMRRVEANLEGSSDPLVAASNLMISAYKNASAKEVVIVAINMTNDNKKIKMNGLTIPNGKFKTYVTTNQKELQFSETSSTEKITLEPKSVTTFVGTYQ